MDNGSVEQSVKKGCLPSEEDKIRECVNFGSVFLGIETKFISAKGLLNWLTIAPVTDITRVAYKAVCIFIPPEQQYLDDNYHFLVKKPDYVAIALGFGFIPEIPDQNLPNVDNPVLCHIVEALTKYHGNKNLRKTISLILSGTGEQRYIESMLDLCYLARNSPHIRGLTAYQINIAAADADWINKLRYNEKLPHLIVKRALKLQEKAPLYYAGVAYQAYHSVAVKLNKDKLLTELTREELMMFNDIFPNIIDIRILEYDDLSYKIALFGSDIAGYVLGFPIQNMIPDNEQIHQALVALKEMGPTRYTEYIRQYVAQTYNPVLPFPQKITPTYPNERDVSYEDIDNYVPFDIIACQIGTHIHRFSRLEAHNLLETKKNPWTGQWLPATVLSTIKARVEAAKELGLPEACPLSEILDKINKGALFASNDTPASIPPPPPNRVIVPSNLLQSLIHLTGTWSPGYDGEAIEPMFPQSPVREDSSSLAFSNSNLAGYSEIMGEMTDVIENEEILGEMVDVIENEENEENEDDNNDEYSVGGYGDW